jgi:hypothetical protein
MSPSGLPHHQPFDLLRVVDDVVRETEGRHEHRLLQQHDIVNVVNKTRVRLAGSDGAGGTVCLLDDIHKVQALEAGFVEWAERIQASAAANTEDRDAQLLTPTMRQWMTYFEDHGGHTSHYTDAQYMELARSGILAITELEVRPGLFVVVGAVTGFCSNPITTPVGIDDGRPRNSDGFHKTFPQFDMRDVAAPSDQMQNVLDAAPHSFLTARSTMLPTLAGPFIEAQLQGETLPPELVGQPLQRMGGPARTKGVVLRIAERLNRRFSTSNIGSLFVGRDPHAYRNKPSTGFNNWMDPIGWRDRFRLWLDAESRLRLKLQAFIGDIHTGINALVGPHGIAPAKGHPSSVIDAEVETGYRHIMKMVETGDHEHIIGA